MHLYPLNGKMIASKRFIDGQPPFIGRHFSCEARNSGRTARVPGFSFRLNLKGGLTNMNLNKPDVIKKLQERFRNVNAKNVLTPMRP